MALPMAPQTTPQAPQGAPQAPPISALMGGMGAPASTPMAPPPMGQAMGGMGAPPVTSQGGLPPWLLSILPFLSKLLGGQGMGAPGAGMPTPGAGLGATTPPPTVPLKMAETPGLTAQNPSAPPTLPMAKAAPSAVPGGSLASMVNTPGVPQNQNILDMVYQAMKAMNPAGPTASV